MHPETSFMLFALSVRENVVKNIAFRISLLCLQLAVYNLSSYFAFRSKAYTFPHVHRGPHPVPLLRPVHGVISPRLHRPHLLTEGHIQRLFFLPSTGWSRPAFIVLTFTTLSPLAGMYDNLLWSLDSPGYVITSSRFSASTVQDQLLATPS
ncbi:hypothetical protein BD779DRAFT_1149911 [Infundibulicybe gibba]|nr:hypothetical protein BD779DRAFT_1149911 [Infundibulicybe gibba]